MRSHEANPGPANGQAAEDLAGGIILYRRAADRTPCFLLLETRGAGHYSPPKGHLDPGESFAAAARRETVEETGLVPGPFEGGFELEIGYQVETKRGPRGKRVVYFLAEAPAGAVRLSEEHVSARWEGIEGVRRLIAFENLRGVFEAAAARLERHAQSAHAEGSTS